MDIYRIAFIGHREIHGQYHIEDRLEQIIIEHLRSKEYVELYVGRNGDFDISVASAAKRVQKAFGHQNSSLILLEPYPMKDDPYYGSFYDEIVCPVERSTHPKGAITKRNRWMIEHADLLVAYVEEGRDGGAYTALKYAERQGLKIINFATEQVSLRQDYISIFP